MTTHIIIPIKDIDLIKMLVDAIDLRADNSPSIKTFIKEFQNKFPNYKHISLNDSDIEEKAKQFADDQWLINGKLINHEHKMGHSFAKDSYSQALKNLK